MAVLTSTGIDFGGANGAVNSRYFVISQNNTMLFVHDQAAAPTGWTRVPIDNRALRVVNSGNSGGTGGGVNAFTNTFVSQTFSTNVPISISSLSLTATSITVGTIAQHSHPLNAGGAEGRNGPNPAQGTNQGTSPGPGTTGGNGANGGAHTHGVNYSSANGPGSCPVNMSIHYFDVNICSYN